MTLAGSTDSPDPLAYERYLRDVQYAQPDNLNARLRLHAKYSTSPLRWFEWLHQQMTWSGVHEVLDVGCGTGLFWSSLPHDLPAVGLTLTDISRTMIDLSLVAADQRVAHAVGVQASVQNLPVVDSSFDTAIANHMLYHATDLNGALHEIRRVIRPGGLLVASTVGPSHLHELVEISRAMFPTWPRRNLGVAFGPVSGIAALERHFDEVEWRTYDDHLRCTNPEDVIAYLTSVPPGSRATPEQLGRLAEEIEQRMDRAGGVLEVTKESGVFLARTSA